MCLRAGDLGDDPRAQFFPDPDLPRSFTHVLPKDDTNSGFDRGHLGPRSDRDHTAAAATATFGMTNILPQAPARKQWPELLTYRRATGFH